MSKPNPATQIAEQIIAQLNGYELADLNKAAFRIGQIIPHGLGRLRGEVLLRTRSEDLGLSFPVYEIHSTIVRGMEAGESNPVASLSAVPGIPANDNDTPLKSGLNVDSLTYPGGLVEELVDWIVSSSERPSRVLALSAVLPFVGAIIGRRFASPSNLRSNLYCVALAPSGYGKDHARGQLKHLITAACLDRHAGPGRFMSATALRNLVLEKPSSLCMIDEFGGMVRQITDPKAGIHNALIKNDLLEIYSSTATYFNGAEFAGTKAVKIHNPNLCIYGTSTPEDFWKALSSVNTMDGLLARFLMFNIEGTKPKKVEPSTRSQDVPTSLVEKVRALVGTEHRQLNLTPGDCPFEAITVPYDDDAMDALDALESELESIATTADPANQPVLYRIKEQAIKLALIVSVASNVDNPVITEAPMRWAIKLARHSASIMMEEAKDRISDSVREANVKKIFGYIKKSGSDGITTGKIADKCKGIEARQRSEIISDLVLAGRIEGKLIVPKTGRPSTRYICTQ